MNKKPGYLKKLARVISKKTKFQGLRRLCDEIFALIFFQNSQDNVFVNESETRDEEIDAKCRVLDTSIKEHGIDADLDNEELRQLANEVKEFGLMITA